MQRKTLLWVSRPKCIYAGSGGEYNNTKKQFNCSFLCMTDRPLLPYTGLYVLLGPRNLTRPLDWKLLGASHKQDSHARRRIIGDVVRKYLIEQGGVRMMLHG